MIPRQATTGKSVLSDIRAGTPTMLSALASREPQWASVSRPYGDPDADEGAAARIRSVMRGSGALGEVERRIAEGADEVRAMLAEAPIEQRLRDDLQLILERCAERRRWPASTSTPPPRGGRAPP